MKTFTGLCWGLTITFLMMAALNVAGASLTAALTRVVS